MAEIHNRRIATRRSGKDREVQQARCHQATRLWQRFTTGALRPGDQAGTERYNRLIATRIATKRSGTGREAQHTVCHQAEGQRGTTGSLHQAIRHGQRFTTGSLPRVLPSSEQARVERHNTRSATKRKDRDALTICVQPTLPRACWSSVVPVQRSVPFAR